VSNRDSDDDLTIALAEYEHLNELRNQLEQKSSNRFNFFLALTTGTVAVSAALLSQSSGATTAVWAVGALALMVLIVGFAMFLRQVRFTGRNVRLTAGQIAIRTYLARRAPAVRPYMYLPVEGDRGVFPGGRISWINQSLGLPGTTALLNSAMLTLALVLALGKWALVPAPVAFVVSLVLQVAYIGRARASWARDIATLNQARGVNAPAGEDSAI
jgi:hypothetical protein